jgi:hypothetical protein
MTDNSASFRPDRTVSPAAPAHAELPFLRRVGPWKALFVLVAVFLIILAGACYYRTAQFRGTYIQGAVPFFSLNLELDPLPTISEPYGTSRLPSFYRGGFDGSLHVYSVGGSFFLDPSLGMSLFGVSLPFYELKPEFQRGEFYVIDAPPGSLWSDLRLERIPPGADFELGAALRESSPDRLIALTERWMLEDPDSATLAFWHAHALLFGGQFDAAKDLLLRMRASLAEAPDPRATILFDHVAWRLTQLQDEGSARIEECLRVFGTTHHAPFRSIPPLANGEERRELVRGFTRRRPLRPFTMSGAASANFLEMQVAAKSMLIEASLAALDGRRQEAHELILGTATMGMPGRPPLTLIEGLIDVAIRSLGASGATAFYIDGAHPAADLEAWWPEVRRIAREAMEPHPLRAWPQTIAGDTLGGVNSDEMLARATIAAVRWRLLLVGYAVRHFRATTGEWPTPTGATLFASLPLRIDQPLVDPFSAPPDAPLGAKIDGDDFLLWSVGPDGTDDGGLVEWDGIGGSIFSGGDLVVRLTPAPRFGFPEDERHTYADEAEFTARFPEGLPRDFFSGPAESLQVARDGSGRVWSVGPNQIDGGGRASSFVAPPDPLYDPTNGTTSPGDQWVALKFSAPPDDGHPALLP